MKKQKQYLMDGGALSNLPIEPALTAGATVIVALDLIDSRASFGANNQFGFFLDRFTFAVEQHQVDLELGLAKACGIPVPHIGLTGKESIPLWDFHHADEFITHGYEITRQAISQSEFIQSGHDRGNALLPNEN